MNKRAFVALLATVLCTVTAFCQEFVDNGIKYSITSIENKTVDVINNDFEGDMIVPESVVYNGDEYAVTGYNAFSSKLTSLFIPSTVVHIERSGLSVLCDNFNSIIVAPDNKVYDSRNNCNAIIKTSSNTLIAGCNSTIIPNSVIFIKERAFDHCAFSTLEIPNSVKTIGGGAFTTCLNLTSINIPSSVISLSGAFYGCSSVSSITVDPNNPIYDSRDNCNAIIVSESNVLEVGCTSTTIPATVKKIDDSAFRDSYITSISIPYGVEEIGNWAFCASKLSSVTISSSVVRVGTGAFIYTPLYESQSDGVIYIDDVAVEYKGDKNEVTSVSFKNGTKIISDGLFENSVNLSSIIFPNDLKCIGNNAFRGCSSLASIDIPNSLISIGNEAFNGTALFDLQPDGVMYVGNIAYGYKSTSWGRLKIKEGTTRILDETFKDCWFLSSVELPGSLTYIGPSAFLGCLYLSEITISESASAIISEDAFDGTAWYESQPDGIVYLGHIAYTYKGNKDGVTSITIKEGTSIVDDRVFDGFTCVDTLNWNSNISLNVVPSSIKSGLKCVNLGNSVKSIDANALSGCADLCSLLIPQSVASIGESAFEGCIGLESLALPEGIDSIGEKAFENCTGLHLITVPSSVEYIAENSFAGCNNIDTLYWNSAVSPNVVTRCCDSKIRYVELGKKIATVEEKAFANCAKLDSITMYEGVVSIGDSAFAGCTGLKSLFIPSGVKSIGKKAYEGCSGISALAVHNNVGQIAEDSFEGCVGIDTLYWNSAVTPNVVTRYCCSKLSFVELGDKISIIEKDEFKNCNQLTSIVIPDGVTAIEDNAFSGCLRMASVTIPKSVAVIESKAFYGCSGIKTLNWNSDLSPASVTAYCQQSLTNVAFGDKVAVIGDFAFNDCGYITSITIPENITRIGDYAFWGCKRLSDIYSYAKLCPNASLRAFNYFSCTVHVPMNLLAEYRSKDPWNKLKRIIPFEFKEIEQVTFSTDGYATFYCSYGDFELPDDVSAYVVTGVENGKLAYDCIAEGFNGGVIPQGVAVMLKRDGKDAATCELKYRQGQIEYEGENLLMGTDVDTVTYSRGSCYYYKLCYGPSDTESSGVVGWFWNDDKGGSFRIDGHKAWLPIPISNQTKASGYSINDDLIFYNDRFENDYVAPDVIYNMHGEKVTEPLLKGLYIINGKKVLIQK